MKKLRIGIFGIGAIGSIISLSLNDKGKYFYFNRSHKNRIELHNNDEILIKEIELTNIRTKQILDWLIICIKEYQFKEASADISKLINARTKVVVIRNGINLKEPMLKYTGAENILACMIDCPIQKESENVYHQLGSPKITLKKSNLSQEFEKLFINNRIELIHVEDYLTANWEKLIESSGIGGILALSGERIRIIKENLDVLELYRRIIKEGIEVARKAGAKIGDDYEEELIKKLNSYPLEKGSSMLTDRELGNRIEINAKNGVISKYGKKYGIKTDLNDIISILLRHTNGNESWSVHNNA